MSALDEKVKAFLPVSSGDGDGYGSGDSQSGATRKWNAMTGRCRHAEG